MKKSDWQDYIFILKAAWNLIVLGIAALLALLFVYPVGKLTEKLRRKNT